MQAHIAAVAWRNALAEIVAPIASRPRLSEPVTRALTFVLANFTRKIRLGEVAAAAGVSPNYLSSTFHRECGATLVRFINRLRVEEAVRLLSEGRRSVTEVGQMVGYQNYRDFHRNFVRTTKVSPGNLLTQRRGSAP